MADVLPPQFEDLLGEADRSIWCGETDDTGRYVCRRIRDHRADRHVARNDAGGIHQWPPTAAAPAAYGVAPDDLHHDDVVTAKQLWEAIRPQFDPNDAWEYTEIGPLLRTFVAVLDRRRAETAESLGFGDLRQRVISELDGMVSEYISPNEFGGWDVDHAQLADVALAVVLPVLERQAAEIADHWRAAEVDESTKAELAKENITLRAEVTELRASREAWAIEAMSQDGLADRFLTFYSRLYDAVSKAAKLPPSQTVDEVVTAVDRLARELERAGANAREWASANDRLRQEREAVSDLLRGMARRASLLREQGLAWRGSALQNKKNWGVALTANVMALETIATLERRLASRPAIPTAADELRRQLLDWADILVRGGGVVVPADIAWKLRHIAAGVSSSDTANADSAWNAGDLALDRTDFVWWRDQRGWRPIARREGDWVSDRDLNRFVGPLVKLAGLPPETSDVGSVPPGAAAGLRASSVSGSDTGESAGAETTAKTEYCVELIWPSWANKRVPCGRAFGADGRCGYGHKRPATQLVAFDGDTDTTEDGGGRG